jgi:hypothetical protein
LHNLQITRAAKAAETDRQLDGSLKRDRLPAFPPDEIRTDDAELLVVNLAGEHELLILTRFDARDPNLACLGPRDAKHMPLPDLVRAKHFSEHRARLVDDAQRTIPVVAAAVLFDREIFRDALFDGGNDLSHKLSDWFRIHNSMIAVPQIKSIPLPNETRVIVATARQAKEKSDNKNSFARSGKLLSSQHHQPPKCFPRRFGCLTYFGPNRHKKCPYNGFYSVVRGAAFAYFMPMMYRLLIGLVWLGTAFLLRAESVALDVLTVGSTTYSNVTVFGANSTDLFFTSDQGVSNVKLKYLSPELQQKFNYNPKTGEESEQQQIDESKRYQENLAASIAAKVKAAREQQEAQIQATYSHAGLGDSVSEESPIGRTAPEMNFTNWVGVAPDLTGKFAIISVWSPKSASSRKWIPSLNTLYKALAGKVEVVGVTSATEAEVTQTEPKIDFPCALDPRSKFLSEAGITMLPCVLLVDTNNVVRYQGHPAAVTTNTLAGLLKNSEE